MLCQHSVDRPIPFQTPLVLFNLRDLTCVRCAIVGYYEPLIRSTAAIKLLADALPPTLTSLILAGTAGPAIKSAMRTGVLPLVGAKGFSNLQRVEIADTSLEEFLGPAWSRGRPAVGKALVRECESRGIVSCGQDRG